MISSKYIFCFVLFVTWTSLKAQLNTGVKVRITKAGFDYGASIAVDLLAEQISSARIPDLSGSGFELKNIRITRFEKPTPDVTVMLGAGLRANLNNAAITVEANWKYSVGKGWFKIRDSGRLTLSSSRFSIGSSLNIGRDSTGRPTVLATSSSCNIGGFDVRFHGGMSVVYNLFARLFENKIRRKLEDLTREEVIKLINTKVKDELASLNVNGRIDEQIQLDYRLSEDPVFDADWMETSHVGEFFSGDIRMPATSVYKTFEMKAPTKMLTIGISERLFNSGGYLLLKLGKFNFNEELKTKDINEFLNLPDESLAFELEGSAPPSVLINPTGLLCNLNASLKLLTLQQQQPTQLVSLQLAASVHLDVRIEAGNVKGNFVSVVPTVVNSNSSLVNLPASEIEQALQYIFGLILPSLNQEADRGFPLPQLDYVAFKDTELSMEEGVLSVSTNVVTSF